MKKLCLRLSPTTLCVWECEITAEWQRGPPRRSKAYNSFMWTFVVMFVCMYACTFVCMCVGPRGPHWVASSVALCLFVRQALSLNKAHWLARVVVPTSQHSYGRPCLSALLHSVLVRVSIAAMKHHGWKTGWGPHWCSSLKEVRTGTQTGQVSRDRNWCRGRGVCHLLACFL